jgi:hypothetical protein
MAKRKMMVDESLRRKADPEYDALKHGLSLQPEHDDPHWTKMRHGHRGKFHKDARYMDNGALMTIRDERLIGNPRRNMSSLEAATKAHPKRVNKELYFSKGVFPPPFEILDQPNLAQAENIVERRRRHHFEEGVIQTARTARKQYPGPEKPEPSNAAFWSSGMVPPPTDGPKSLNASQEQNVVQRSKAREFGLNGCIMTYRRGDTGRSEMDTGRSTLRNGRSSAALEVSFNANYNVINPPPNYPADRSLITNTTTTTTTTTTPTCRIYSTRGISSSQKY